MRTRSRTTESEHRVRHCGWYRFQTARKRRNKLTLVHKTNVLALLWRRVVEVGTEFPDVNVSLSRRRGPLYGHEPQPFRCDRHQPLRRHPHRSGRCVTGCRPQPPATSTRTARSLVRARARIADIAGARRPAHDRLVLILEHLVAAEGGACEPQPVEADIRHGRMATPSPSERNLGICRVAARTRRPRRRA